MKKIDAETFLAFRYPSNARISPDGDLVAMLLKQPVLDENRYLSDIWIAERKSGAVRRLTARRNVAAYCWMPCGNILFTLAGDKPEKGVATKYYKISPFGGEAEEFACLPIRGGMPVFLEDGRWLVNAQTDLLTDDEDPAPGNETKPRDDSYRVFEEVPFWSNGNGDVSKRRQTLFVCDPKEGCVKRLTPRDFDVYSFDCKGDAVVMTGASFDCTRPHEPGLYTACLRDLTMKEIVAPLGYDISSPVFVDEQTALFQMKKAHVNRYAVGDLCSLDVFSGEITTLHPCDYSMGYGGATTDVSQDSGRGAVACGGKLWFIETEDDGSYVRCCGRDGVFSERLTKYGSTTSIDVKDGYAVIIAQRGDKLPEVYELLPGCEEKQITCFNEEVFKELEVSTPKFMKYTGSDGFEIHGWIMAPIGYEPGKKYPAILNIHGGPRGVFGSVFHHEMQLWAARGYFVLFCNPRGSDGKGEKFANLYGKYGDWDYVNIIEFTDKCLETCPDIDPERLGVTGGSYGGYMTNWIIG
ncbi:MAG: S9 family peptidase, partial [Firmicutes bacterium]|nr:S9 family peptidase [Bacillota bacterium]